MHPYVQIDKRRTYECIDWSYITISGAMPRALDGHAVPDRLRAAFKRQGNLIFIGGIYSGGLTEGWAYEKAKGSLSAALPRFSLNVSDSKPARAAATPYRGGRSSRARAPMLARLRSTDELYALCEACAARGNKNGVKRHLAAGFIPVEYAVPQSRLIVLICADSSIQLASWCQ